LVWGIKDGGFVFFFILKKLLFGLILYTFSFLLISKVTSLNTKYIMKGLIIGIIFIALLSIKAEKTWFSETSPDVPQISVAKIFSELEDGWYPAKVTYSSHKKITKTTSTLKVEVQNNKVVKIDLGNGKILHEGENQTGYFYSGGVLSFDFDSESKTTIATTSVIIKDTKGNLSFYAIRIA
jgi:hypothetical protein